MWSFLGRVLNVGSITQMTIPVFNCTSQNTIFTSICFVCSKIKHSNALYVFLLKGNMLHSLIACNNTINILMYAHKIRMQYFHRCVCSRICPNVCSWTSYLPTVHSAIQTAFYHVISILFTLNQNEYF